MCKGKGTKGSKKGEGKKRKKICKNTQRHKGKGYTKAQRHGGPFPCPPVPSKGMSQSCAMWRRREEREAQERAKACAKRRLCVYKYMLSHKNARDTKRCASKKSHKKAYKKRELCVCVHEIQGMCKIHKMSICVLSHVYVMAQKEAKRKRGVQVLEGVK